MYDGGETPLFMLLFPNSRGHSLNHGFRNKMHLISLLTIVDRPQAQVPVQRLL